MHLVNGKIKRWRYFSNVIQNSSIPCVGDNFKIICAIINCYQEAPTIDNEEGERWAEQMLRLMDVGNKLEKRLEGMASSKKKTLGRNTMQPWCFFPNYLKTTFVISALVSVNFLSWCHLKRFWNLGDYQISQAKGYIQEHLKPSVLDEEQVDFVVELCPAHPDLVRVRFASRHSSSKNYIATVQFDSKNDEQPIQGWYCTCCSGARVIGCCAHTTALLWHLGVCRGQVDSQVHPLSASRLLLSVEDCIRYHDTQQGSDEENNDPNWILTFLHTVSRSYSFK